MIDVVDIGDRFDRHVIFDATAICSLDADSPFARFRTHQDNFARRVIDHQRVRIRYHVHRRRLAGGDVVDYVTLSRIQRESHCCAVIGKQQAGLKHEHANSCN